MRSRRIWLSTLWLIGLTAVSLTGCGSGKRHSSGSAYATLQWDIFDLGDTTGAYPLACEDIGAGAVVLTMTDAITGENYTDTFDCRDYQGATAYVPPGTYTATLELHSSTPVAAGASTLLDQVVVDGIAMYAGANDLSVADFFVNSFVLNWESCAGGAKVELDIYFPGQTQPTAYELWCQDAYYSPATGYRYATMAIPYGSYAISWQAFLQTASGLTLYSSPLTNYNVQTYVQAELYTSAF